MKIAILLGALALAYSEPSSAAFDNSGTYLCTVAEKAGITSRHSELAGHPSAAKYDNPMTRFKMVISPIKGQKLRFRLLEIEYAGPDRDDSVWHTEKSVLHGEYRGDGNRFMASEDQAFLSFGKTTAHKNSDGDFEFYHSGFEYPGGEDTKLSVRWGRCRKLS
ncbi:MAG: hypothetical protein V4696_04125 [Pseudomonadota bacterium]